MQISRRNVLSGAASLGTVLGATPGTITRARASATQRLTAGTRVLEVNGKAAKVFGLVGPNGLPGITLAPGERFAVTLDNQAGIETIVHWHGQLPDWRQDGVPWPQTPPLAPGAQRVYDYTPIPGTFWMHSHQGMQEQQLMAAPLIVHDTASANAQEVVMMLHDFSFKTPDELMAGLTKKGGMMGGMGSGGMGG
ncbi:MAG: multicopper oxidase domain-containing protein, partial [Acidocella sp.]|nr:multicopper oxidase domain-containing protein [Acidocella sp.]